jgi:hypothetical protein
MSLINKLEPENVIYDIVINGLPDIDNKAIFSVNRTDTILSNPSDYYMGILDFSIPLYAIPLFSFVDNRYSFSLEYDGLTLTTILLWVPETINFSPVFQSVYSYQSFIKSMNNALKTLYINMAAAKPLFLPTEQPFITLDNNRVTINIQDWYYLNNSFVCCNEQLFHFLTSIDAYFISPIFIRFIYNNHMPSYNRLGNVYFSLTQANDDLSNWSSLSSVIISTNQVPVSGELIGTQNNDTILVLGDFVSLLTENRISYYNYISKSPIRLCNLNSDYPLSSIDCQIRFYNREGASEIIQIPANANAYIKLIFVKRSFEDLNNIDNCGYGIR